MKNNKALAWTIVGIIVVGIVIGLIVHARNKKDDLSSGADQTSQNSQNGNSLVSTEDVTAGSVHSGTSGASEPALTYEQALAQYATRRIQFDANCQATPDHSTFKNGVTLMLDNRSGGNRTLHLGTFGNISVKAWGFKIVNFTSSFLPNAVAVDCNATQNVAIITLQK